MKKVIPKIGPVATILYQTVYIKKNFIYSNACLIKPENKPDFFFLSPRINCQSYDCFRALDRPSILKKHEPTKQKIPYNPRSNDKKLRNICITINPFQVLEEEERMNAILEE